MKSTLYVSQTLFKDKRKTREAYEGMDDIHPSPKMEELARTLKAYSMSGLNKSYAWAYLFCEVLNILCLMGNMYLTDIFLGGEFRSYGRKVLQFLLTNESPVSYDPMNYIFPKETICDFHIYGPSGNIQRNNYLCLLPVNIFNEKVYIFLW